MSKPNNQSSRSIFYCFRAFLILVFSVSAFSLSAQEKVVVVGGSSIAPFSKSVNINTKITEIAYQKRLVGSFYLNDDWAKTDVYLKMDSAVLRDIHTRIDLRNNVLEIKTKDDTLVLPTYRIKSLFYKEKASLFVTENIVKSPTKGFFQVLVDDKYSLLCQAKVKVEPSDFNIITNTGSRDDKIIQSESYYLFTGETLLELEKSKGKFKKQFGKNEKMSQFLNQHKVKPKSKTFLIDLVNFINVENLDI